MTGLFRLTPRAAADLDGIADYTMEVWGAAQMGDYLRSLNRRFEWLARNPLAGRERNDVHPGYRSFPEGSHVIFYIVSDEYIDIIGLPHKSMDIGPGTF
jgi:toxin ParE1/3/4